MGDVANLSLNWRSVMLAMICLPILIGVFLLFLKKAERSAASILALLLLASVIAIIPQIIGFAEFYKVWPGLTFFPFPTELWLGPLFYLHAHILLREKPLGWRKYLLIPGIVQSTYYCWAYTALGDYQNKWDFNNNFHEPYILPIETILSIVMIVVALLRVKNMYRQYMIYVNNTESAAIEFDPVWLDRIILLVLIAAILFTSIEVTSLFVYLSYNAAFPVQVMIMLMLAWLSIEAVWRLNTAFPKIPKRTNFEQFQNGAANHFKSSAVRHLMQTQLSESTSQSHSEISAQNDETLALAASESLGKNKAADKQILIKQGIKIRQAVQINNWYLQPRFSLKQLAKNMASNEVYISKAINQGLGITFNDFINNLRIEHAQALIMNSDLPLLSIALDSGFNSKATFNRVFKDNCDLTPSQYRRLKGIKT